MTTPTEPEQEPVKPIGTPLPLEALMKVSNVTQRDFDRAIATANPRLRRYLKARGRER